MKSLSLTDIKKSCEEWTRALIIVCSIMLL